MPSIQQEQPNAAANELTRFSSFGGIILVFSPGVERKPGPDEAGQSENCRYHGGEKAVGLRRVWCL